ncbi:sugar transporter SWEET1 [Halichoeres trimaculatus]|uniref:sugar transporter SWEET1 n=1 Tax=Halichoeres trimaculatus TaxID=147232 RepID=UPI003D9ECBD8
MSFTKADSHLDISSRSMDPLQLLSWACIVFTVGMFSTGLTDLKKMQESKSADNIQFLPFLTTCLNNLGWLYYGVLKKDQTIILVNVIGALLQILYIIVYHYYTKQKRLVFSQTLVAGGVLACGWFYFTTVLPEGETRLSQLGLTCSVVTVSMYMSPLIDLVEIVRRGDVKCLSFPLTVATFFTSTSWVLYGLQLNDNYIVVPNTPGILTSLIRFYLFRRFASANQSSPPYKSMHMSG